MAVLAKLEAHSDDHAVAAAALAELEAMNQENATEVAPAEIWGGTNEEIKAAKDTIASMELKIERLSERLKAPFMSETTKASIEAEIQKSQDIKHKLQGNVDRTMERRAGINNEKINVLA